ncbi:glycosyl hydrolase 53 family protein [Butyrivibrio proteoclasticus]|uniref:glycosyl hydrolase 53 family protein n=1 Tax=Butyrivibrio proteoclasticus TaxID=43305 RepID=UPI001FA72DFD|nr:glycosyl hydrolase 53 family protein [Butyrivibrio proteoclasticus]
MNKKKICSFVMSAMLGASLLFGCAGNNGSTDGSSNNSNDISTEEMSGDAASLASTADDSQGSWKDPIDGLPEDFICGMDASSVLVEENSGVKYYDFEGNEADVFEVLADSGVNYIRLRVWNDPYDAEGNGYGGGNNDLATAIELGKRATDAGMKVMIDFHYSDFWADPKRQHAPKAWEGMNLEEKETALYEFTKNSLAELLEAGVDVGMVQTGNEINYGMSGETKLDNVIALLKEGSKAIREVSASYDKEISVVVHYTRIQDKADVLDLVDKLVSNELDFDMIGMSYYPFWDGSMENMSRVLELIQERYKKKVFLAETSYCYTTEDGDGSGNSLSVNDLVEGYGASVDGQGQMIHDICSSVNAVGGLGIFYWEGTWIPVGPANADNSAIWEKYGSGWASSYASDYDPEDAGKYYGGCSWDNQAMFDFEGHPLESLNVFKYMRGDSFVAPDRSSEGSSASDAAAEDSSKSADGKSDDASASKTGENDKTASGQQAQDNQTNTDQTQDQQANAEKTQQSSQPQQQGYGRILFIGDSRTVDMFDGGATEIMGGVYNGITVYCRNAAATNFAYEAVNSAGLDNFDTVVFWMGANNYGDFSSYAPLYESILSSGKQLVVCTVGPSQDESLEADDRPYYDNERMVAFNNSLVAWANNHGVKVIDLYTYCVNNITIDPNDGIHYQPQPTTALWNYIVSSL